MINDPLMSTATTGNNFTSTTVVVSEPIGALLTMRRAMFVFTVARYATYLLLFARCGSAVELSRKDRCRMTNYWMNNIAFIRQRPWDYNAPCRCSNSKILFRSLQRRLRLQILPVLYSANNEGSIGNTKIKHRVTTDPTSQNPSTKNDDSPNDWCRRQLLLSSAVMLTSTITLSLSQAASARGLVHFPCVRSLANTYHFMRVGVTLLEEQGTKQKIYMKIVRM